MDKINIAGINISTLSKEGVLEKIRSFLSFGQHQITTPNPEFVVRALKDEEFFYVLNNSSLAIADGFGLVLAGKVLGSKIEKIHGSDLIYDICRIAEQEKKSVYLLGGKGGVAKSAAANLKKIFPDLIIAGTDEGFKDGEWELEEGHWVRGEEKNKLLIEEINGVGPDIIFVAFGHPKQDKWIYHNLKNMPSVKIAMGVGGSFDFISGKVRRAPNFLRALGMEWFWRLAIEPWRWKRIIDAVIIFPWKFFKWKYVLPHFYRPNVACVLYKKEGDRYKILLVKRNDIYEHWQLPQGGTDGEKLEKAGARELREELGTDKFKPVASFKNLHKYAFSKAIKTSQIKRYSGFKGQKQGLFIAEFLGNDKDIKIKFWDHEAWKWVDSERLLEEIHFMRRESAKIFLEKFSQVIK